MAQVSGSSAPFLTATKTITSAQIKALNTTAIQLLPAVPGALVLPVSVTWLLSPVGTTAYTVPGQLYVDACNAFAGSGTALNPVGISAMLAAAPAVRQVAADEFLSGLPGFFTSADALIAGAISQPVMLMTDTGNPTLGDSGLKAVIVYQVATP